jgi:hypothetical protein
MTKKNGITGYQRYFALIRQNVYSEYLWDKQILPYEGAVCSVYYMYMPPLTCSVVPVM